MWVGTSNSAISSAGSATRNRTRVSTSRKTNLDAVTNSVTIEDRQHEQPQPCEESNGEHATPLHLQRIAAEMRAAIHLKQSATQKHRKVRPPLAGLVGYHVLITVWRRGWDSNPRYLAVNTLSKRAPSATRPPLQTRALTLESTTWAGVRACQWRVCAGEIKVSRRLNLLYRRSLPLTE